MSISTDTPDQDLLPRPSRALRFRSQLLALAAVLILGFGFLAGWVAHRPPAAGVTLFGPSRTFGETRAMYPRQLAYFLGQQRASDGMTYGEWARTKFLHQCDGMDPRSLRFDPLEQGPFSSEGIRYEIMIFHAAAVPGCAESKLLVNIGGFMSDSGRIVPLSPTESIGESRFGVDSESNLLDTSRATKDAWWTRFRSGEAP